MHRILATIALVLALSTSQAQSSITRLSTTQAKRAIVAYEQRYWHDDRVTTWGCKHQSILRVSCTAEIHYGPRTLRIFSDMAILLPRGVIRVHPGVYYEEIEELGS